VMRTVLQDYRRVVLSVVPKGKTDLAVPVRKEVKQP